MRLTLAVTAVSALLSLLTTGSLAQIAAPSSEITVTVVDQTGALINDSEVVFKSDSATIVSRTGKDGSPIIVRLPSGRYVVSASKLGFLKSDEHDFQPVAPVPAGIKIFLKIDPAYCKTNACTCSPCVSLVETPTITSDLPNVIENTPSRVQPAEPSAKRRKTRSLQCLYLWKCSG